MPNYRKEPPRWQLDAIPTAEGWRHPKTGELLVSCKGIEILERPTMILDVASDSETVAQTPEVEPVVEEVKRKPVSRKKKVESDE